MSEHTQADVRPTGIAWDPLCLAHQPGRGHPECPERCAALLRGIREGVPPDRVRELSVRPATESEILACHTPEYVEIVKDDVRDTVRCLRTGDTDLSDQSLEAALMAAGCVISAADAVLDGSVTNAFCPVRPPGHHAESDAGMGFCIFNNVAVAVRHVQSVRGIDRVLVADWDLHHGNGTQEIFYDDPSVYFFSTHQWPCYPGSGKAGQRGIGHGRGFTRNCPFPLGSGRTEILGAFREVLVPAMRQFRPQFVFVSAGFDGHADDPLGSLLLQDDDYAELTGVVLDIAAEHADDRLVSVLEGGYHLGALERLGAVHVAALAGCDR